MASLIGKAFKSRITQKPFSLDFSVTFKCNARCRHCNIWRDPPPKKELTTTEIQQIFSSYHNIKSFGITGGEPFLRQDLTQILNIIAETQKPQILFITTNGSLTAAAVNVVSKFVKKWPDVPLKILISVDGPPKLHDNLRGFPVSPKLLKTIRQLCKLRVNHYNLAVGTVTLYSPYNYSEYDAVLSYIDQLITKYSLESTFCMYFESYYYRNQRRPRVFLQHLKKYLPRMKKLMARGTSKSLAAGRVFCWDLVQKWAAFPGRQVIPCKSGLIRFVLNPYGVLYPCFGFNYPVADLRNLNYSLPAAFSRAATVQKLIKKEKCPCCCLTCELIPTLMASVWRVFI